MCQDKPSLENLIESEDIGLEVLHPGGTEITEELAELCNIREGKSVLDVACGTGESACFIAEKFKCKVMGIDASEYMIQKAREKAKNRRVEVEFKIANAHNLPFGENLFDAVISECTTCLLHKEKAISEMKRVCKSGGYVGIHDVCWKDKTPVSIKRKLAEIEGERPETLDGWKKLFEDAGLVDVIAIDKSHLMKRWRVEIKKKLGIIGQLRIFAKVLRNWGLSGLKTIRESQSIFESEHIGYGIIVGRKP